MDSESIEEQTNCDKVDRIYHFRRNISFPVKAIFLLPFLCCNNAAFASVGVGNLGTNIGNELFSFSVIAKGEGSFSEAIRSELQNAVRGLLLHGDIQVCRTYLSEDYWGSELFPDVPTCNWLQYKKDSTLVSSRSLTSSSWWDKWSEKIVNSICALICISIAALAAGLTLGMLGLDPLMLLIKQRASSDPLEREQATNLLPIVKQHHLLLVTLLLMNAVANEALPIFLEALVPPSVAVIFSVVFVLFFGEIIPSAIFTGPSQMKIASKLTPVVKAAMCLLYPVAGPISLLLDRLLHDEDDEGGNFYQRSELSALIRIQYEERMASKRKRKKERKNYVHSPQVQLMPDDDHIGSLDFPTLKSFREEHRESIRATKSHIQYHDSKHVDATIVCTPISKHSGRCEDSTWKARSSTGSDRSAAGSSVRSETSTQAYEESGFGRSNSIHIDEVTMVEGALSMKVKVAMDVYTPLRRVFCIPHTTVLSEKGIVKIYASGFSRIPVYCEDSLNQRNRKHILGILLTKQLIVVDPHDKRSVTSMPLYTPLCVSPQTTLVDLVNIFQTGGKGMTGGHLALVCARPRDGNNALAAGKPLPDTAELMGVITLEDVLETLLQEQIFDENDKYERDAHRLAQVVWRRWRRYVVRKKKGLLQPAPRTIIAEPALSHVVDEIVAAQKMEEGVNEETSLLVGNTKPSSKS